MKVWRNSEGREFVAEIFHERDIAKVGHVAISAHVMRELGYELVELEPEEFEVECEDWFVDSSMPGHRPILFDPRLIPGELYSVRKVKR